MLEGGHQRAPVRDTGELIGDRLVAARDEQPLRGAERQHEPREHRGKSRTGHRYGDDVHTVEVVVDEEQQRKRAKRRRQSNPMTLLREERVVPGVLPPSEAHQQKRQRPQRVEHPAIHVRAGGVLVKIGAVADREDQEPGEQPQPGGVRRHPRIPIIATTSEPSTRSATG